MADELGTQEVTTEETKEQFIKCPCCGELTLRKPLDIKSAVLDEYMASLISGVPFQHTYTLHNSIDITASALTKSDKDKIYATLQLLDTMSKTIGENDPASRSKVDELAADIQLYYYVSQIQARKQDKVIASFTPASQMSVVCDTVLSYQPRILAFAIGKDDPTNIVADLVTLYDTNCTEKTLSAIPDVMLRAIVRTHNDLYNILMNNGFDENFWKGIELV